MTASVTAPGPVPIATDRATLPSFVFIGTGKTGTTWLFHQLAKNPAVYLTPVKETNYFDLNYERGLEWYQRFFADAPRGAEQIGEISHRYINNADTADRIADDLGPIKIIAALRKPDDFARSDHQFAVRNGRWTGDLNSYLDGPFEWESIAYAEMLQPFLDRFGRNGLLVLDFAQFAVDPTVVLHQVERFLAVEPTPAETIDVGVVNGAASPRSRSVALVVNKTSKAIKRRGGQRIIQTVKGQDWLQQLLYRRTGREEWPIAQHHLDRLDHHGHQAAATIDAELGTDLSNSWYPEQAR